MPRGRPGASAVAERPAAAPASTLGLSAIPTVIPGHQPLNYDQMMSDAGVFREGDGLYHYLYVVGEATSANGKALRRKQKFPVALSAEEARIKTKTTGERHDWLCPGIQCPRCQEMLTGWVLGGRKFQAEHDHVTVPDPTRFIYEEVEDDATDEAEAVAVEA